ncbi:MAG: hypothetical protein MUC85_08320 [Anaerolineales bacterium]|jgi:hypothetical protein|nr:hypothetical protein [Anaerolineales bacterium]
MIESPRKSSQLDHNYALLGFWSAIAMTIAVLFSGISASTALKMPSLISGIILIPIFILFMTCIHEYAPTEKKLCSRLGLLFSTGYATLIGFNYYMQLTLVRKGLYSDVFAMDDPQSVMIMIEALGYGFMGLATLFTAFSLPNGKIENAIRWLFIFNGILGIGGIVGYALDLNFKILAGGLIVWDIIMPISSVLVAIIFLRILRWK